jgi:glycosyltransferase involved in cell wall biosynthesis
LKISEPTAPMFSVIIPTYRDWPRLALCLDALAKQTIPGDWFEVIVVNNDPADPCPLPLASNVLLLEEAGPGSYVARNTGVLAGRGVYLAFTDGDCVPDPEWLASAYTILAAAPYVRVTGPISIFRETGAGHYAYLYEFHTAFRQKEHSRSGVCATANLIVSRAIFDTVGFFDASRFSGGDFEWNKRAQARGIPLNFDERVAVAHPARRTLREIMRKKRRTAGGALWARSVSTGRLLLGIIRPPVRAVSGFNRGSVPISHWIPLAAICWLMQVVENLEVLLVRYGLRKPARF